MRANTSAGQGLRIRLELDAEFPLRVFRRSDEHQLGALAIEKIRRVAVLLQVESGRRPNILLAHILFRKPVATFRIML
jgi:hypothetical protein